jgi:hypothetical protein
MYRTLARQALGLGLLLFGEESLRRNSSALEQKKGSKLRR